MHKAESEHPYRPRNQFHDMTKNTTPVYIGVDVAKATLQMHLLGAQFEFANTPKGRAQMCEKVARVPGAQVVCEATGGYEQALVADLHQAQTLVSVVNPAQVRAAAQAKGQRAKSDPIDARGLTDYGVRYQPPPTPPRSKVQLELAALVQWLKQLVNAQAVAKVQAEHHHAAFVVQQHAELLEHYQRQIKTVEAKLQKLQEHDRALQQRVQRLDAIAGVGARTALLLLACLPELGSPNRREAAALSGLAPWTRESGTMKGKRCIGGGRAEVRVALYMSALTATRCNPILKAFYEGLIRRNKPGKVALTAVMRKLVIHMNNELKKLAAKLAVEEKKKIRKSKKSVAK
jgi:transposase